MLTFTEKFSITFQTKGSTDQKLIRKKLRTGPGPRNLKNLEPEQKNKNIRPIRTGWSITKQDRYLSILTKGTVKSSEKPDYKVKAEHHDFPSIPSIKA